MTMTNFEKHKVEILVLLYPTEYYTSVLKKNFAFYCSDHGCEACLVGEEYCKDKMHSATCIETVEAWLDEEVQE